MTNGDVVETVEFGGTAYTRTESGQLVTPEFLALMQSVLTGKIERPADLDDIDPEVKALADELSVIHLPEWRRGAGATVEPTVTRIRQANRVAEYLVKRGVRLHPELEEIRWSPTPGGHPGAFDTGVHITKDEHGQWPVPDPESFYDVDDIVVNQAENGLWCAVHPRGLVHEAPTKSEAHAGLVTQLLRRIEEVR
ncbi:hypothetical protein [Nocardia noduli]|uniref:hypothetical protein n=1 Tax=Nocardia noduli TaxID=2815722 RepID=UPI001C24F82B|nr:hypothetical protein [Nocardia noduli]